jgi:hypothetical protein
MWQRVAARQKRELPSFVTTTMRPLSAETKFAPVCPTSACRYLCRQEMARAARDRHRIVVVSAEPLPLEALRDSHGDSCE